MGDEVVVCPNIQGGICVIRELQTPQHPRHCPHTPTPTPTPTTGGSAHLGAAGPHSRSEVHVPPVGAAQGGVQVGRGGGEVG